MKSKEVKRAEAMERQAAYDALPSGVKQLKVHLSPGNSDRQRRRLGMLQKWEEELLGGWAE